MSHIERESRILKFWEENKIFEKSVNQRSEKLQYIFYDGPPFATGLPHYGNILGFISKDLFPRYWTMKGYRCERRWGWDCHGLPIENIAEAELKIKEKKEILTLGIDKFNEYCRSRVLWYANAWKEFVRRMGKWIEFDNAYKTMDNTYMETVWYIFKTFFDKKLIYEGKRILLYCPRCETPLSKFEITMDNSYKDVSEKSIVVKFKIIGVEPRAYILAWTTTPWTLIGNVALAVNSKLDYVKVKSEDEFLILTKSAIKILNTPYEIVEEFKGTKLLGLKYEPLYEIEDVTNAYFIVDGEDGVSSEEGTGVVHLAAYGEFDLDMIQKYKISFLQHLNEAGRLKKGPAEWIGMWFKDLDKKVAVDLYNRIRLYRIDDYTHSYPFCYRCETPLIYNAINSWFVDIQKIKDRVLEKSKEINWYPSSLKLTFENVIKSAPDWTISRNRFWATAIPVWRCEDCHALKVIGSTKELKEIAIEQVKDDLDLHKHVVDNIHIRCHNCGKTMARIPEVFDCWLESGSMPFAAMHFPFENTDWFKQNFPCDFVAEYIAQVRAWYYYMLVVSVAFIDKIPFKNVVVSGVILAADGKKMSKSKKNFTDPMIIIDRYGGDGLRFHLFSSPVMRAEDINFIEENLKETYKNTLMLLTNIKNFYVLFCSNNRIFDNPKADHIMDQWIISRLHATIKSVTIALDDYNSIAACSEILSLIDDISTWYIRRSRNRFKDTDSSSKPQAARIFGYVLMNLSKLIAPLMPFIAEDIYQSFRTAKKDLVESVHLCDWPIYSADLISTEILENMQLVRRIVNIALEIRAKEKIPVRQVLSSLKIKGTKLENKYLDIIRDELNVKEVSFAEGTELSIELETSITPELKIEGIYRDLVRHLNNIRRKKKLSFKNRIKLFIETSDDSIKASIKKFKEQLMKSIQADAIIEKLENKPDIEEIEINNSKVKIYIEKTS